MDKTSKDLIREVLDAMDELNNALNMVSVSQPDKLWARITEAQHLGQETLDKIIALYRTIK